MRKLQLIKGFRVYLEIKRKRSWLIPDFMVFQGFGRSYWTVSLDIGWFGQETLSINFLNQMYI